MKPGDLVTLRDMERRFVVQPYAACAQFCVPVVSLADEATGLDVRLVAAEDVRPAQEPPPPGADPPV